MSDKAQSFGEQVRSGLKGIHGIGEAIRGTAMEATDEAFNTKDGAAKNKAIADKGFADAKQADHNLGHNHGIGSNNTAHTATNTPGMPTTTGAGVHSTAPGNIGTTGSNTVNDTTIAQEQPGINQRF
ncbi:hypothetical protein H2198_002688 [Neophaeococcomyces mojaviensis]|uniref:Uncharacterized protein n=1 Tax=Neophaeococcomyces mojaviensis TaxID=3383035 RepID=A0ACC3ADD3_9EURO|nr:hypothetical protein H2198_002688 [Knufia sp. JES_112]